MLVMAGDLDPICPPVKVRKYAGLIPHSQIIILPGADRISAVEQPSIFNQEIDSFLEA
ncbi:MAG: hypothetical protein PUP91_30615 [Rhizonema sp. PD37]|nr:hypothetical protein [Rhizonema sp. PD37]